ncbi:MAG: hypothetical protein JEZ11_12290 [Desulfobacterales bacterium]|nr:hypothetical protein [Desulfobacterales bacterium]
MTEKTVAPSTIDKDKLIPRSDVECASDCNETWQDCQEAQPEKKGVCNTTLAKCVKQCDETAK